MLLQLCTSKASYLFEQAALLWLTDSTGPPELLHFPPGRGLVRYFHFPTTLMEAKAGIPQDFVGNEANAVTLILTKQKNNVSGQ